MNAEVKEVLAINNTLKLPFKKAVVAVDLSHMDCALLKYLKFSVKIFGIEELEFIYVQVPMIYPLTFGEDMIDNIKNEKELKFEFLKKKVFKTFKEKIKTNFHYTEGDPLTEILQTSEKINADLIIAGRKKDNSGDVVPQRLARKANCHVLLVPESFESKYKRVLVPLDFSEHSELALQKIKKLSGNLKGFSIFCLNVLYAHSFPITVGHTEKAYKEDKSRAKDSEFRKFVERYEDRNYNLKTFFLFDDFDNPYSDIIQFAKEKNCDLIIMGSKGKTSASAILLGSTTEKIIKNNYDIPILIVKKKDENLGLINLLFS